MKNFALIGVGGYIAPRHLEAIKNTGNRLVVAFDIIDSVGILDRYNPEAYFFNKWSDFNNFVDQCRGTKDQIDFVSICSPNYLHYEHIKFSLEKGANVICEKPLVLITSEIDKLRAIENKYSKKVSSILQLRYHQAVLDLKKYIDDHPHKIFEVNLEYITSRGRWYYQTWKANEEKSGGLITNIGVHLFDMLTWVFGDLLNSELVSKNDSKASGKLKLTKANVNWMLSIDKNDLPNEAIKSNKSTFRSLKIDGKEFEFSDGFTDLHTTVYKNIFEGNGFGLDAAFEAIRIVEELRKIKV